MVNIFVNNGNSSCYIDTIDWGQTLYEDAFEQQKVLVDKRIAGVISDTLVFTEHTPVYTIGKRRNAEQNLIWNEAQRNAEGIRVIHTNRGGDITYHGPGQIVGYPIISLEKQKDLHTYLRKLEEVVIRTLARFKINAARRKGKTGIWVDARKICAIGIAVRKWVTYHGFALNVSPYMDHFSGIVPCGITDSTVTSMENELVETVDLAKVKKCLLVEFKAIFSNVIKSYE